jgi:hypothetical protein
MNLKISYEEVQKRYPVLVDEIMAKLRSGKSIHKNAKPEDLDWSFDWCQRISGGCSFADMLKDISKPKPPRPSVQERMAEVIPNLLVHLAASIGRWWGRTEQIPVPEEVLDSYRKGFENDDAEHLRFNALPKQEQDREVNEAIFQLSKSPGFRVIGIPVDKKP